MSHCSALGVADLEGLRLLPLDPAPAEAVEKEEEEGVDHIDRLPDALLLVIFNQVGDVKALGRCCIVSRRFQALAALVEDVIVRVDCVISDDPSPSLASAAGGAGSGKPHSVFSSIARAIGGLVKPFQALGQILSPSASSCSCADASSAIGAARESASSLSDVSHHSPAEVLKNFKEIRRLRIELPDGELGVGGGVLLKWRANFGSTLDSCVILGASSILSLPSECSNPDPTHSFDDACAGEDCGGIPDSFYMDGSLKRRVVWTISSLIAASARHYLLHPIVADHETLHSLALTDADGQGVLTMNRQQLHDLRTKPVMASGNSQRTLLPALSMRLWYAHQLDLPGGMVLKGATLLAIRPSEERTAEAGNCAGGCSGFSDVSWVADAFEEPYQMATRMLMKRKTYCLEMNSF